MATFVIDTKRNRVYIPIAFEGVYDFGSIECSIGNIIEALEKEFPASNYVETGYTTNLIRNKLAGKGKSKTLWGVKENGFTIQAIHFFLSGRDKIELKKEEIEEFRIMYGLSVKHTPLNPLDVTEGLQVKNATSILDIVFHLLYYYALNNLKLVKCEHCGRWFVTNTFKKKYCSRNSTFDGYTHLKCEQAVRNISQELQREKKRIYNNMTTYKDSSNPDVYSFLDECAFRHGEIKKRATVENLKAYFDFLKRTKEGES